MHGLNCPSNTKRLSLRKSSSTLGVNQQQSGVDIDEERRGKQNACLQFGKASVELPKMKFEKEIVLVYILLVCNFFLRSLLVV